MIWCGAVWRSRWRSEMKVVSLEANPLKSLMVQLVWLSGAAVGAVKTKMLLPKAFLLAQSLWRSGTKTVYYVYPQAAAALQGRGAARDIFVGRRDENTTRGGMYVR